VPPGTIPRGPYVRLPRRPKSERNRFLSLNQVANLTNALAFADSQDRSLSVQITVAWEFLPKFAPATWSAQQTKLMKTMSEWLRHCGIKPTYVWVREVSDSLWHHTHIQLHIPKRQTRRIARELVTFLGHSFGFLPGGLKEELGIYGMWNQAMRAGGLRYWLKGIDHRDFRYRSLNETVNVAAAIGIEHRGTQGIVPIKRAGTSQNLGRAMRRATGWTERRSLEDLRVILRPPETLKKTKPKTMGLLLGHRGRKPLYWTKADPKGPPHRRVYPDVAKVQTGANRLGET
jgi:hypothetical protein